ncbi:MAG TPA: hypothetical protein VII11_07105 [Bacteroidota bacterium]
MEFTDDQDHDVTMQHIAAESLANGMTFPPATGSMRRGDYRFGFFRDASLYQLFRLQRQFYAVILERFSAYTPRKDYRQYPFIAAGWEWSVFRKDETTVVKVPAGIFPEIDTALYRTNIEHTYRTVLSYYPTRFIAQSVFLSDGGLNSIVQDYQSGRACVFIPFDEPDKNLVRNLKDFYRCTLRMLQEQHWMPDVHLSLSLKGFTMATPNVIIDERTSSPVLVDFSYYNDPFRLYPAFKYYSLVSKGLMVLLFLTWASIRLEATP